MLVRMGENISTLVHRFYDESWNAWDDGVVEEILNEVVDLVVAGERAAARLRYTGHHRGELLGYPATGRAIAYDGAAFFTAADGRLAEVWVLGDLAALRAQLGG